MSELFQDWLSRFTDNLSPLVVVGLVGQTVFMMRFLVQWIASERAGRSVVPIAFWWLSLGGAALLFTYAVLIADPVFILGQSLGFVIYSRNLVLIRKSNQQAQTLGARAAPAEELGMEPERLPTRFTRAEFAPGVAGTDLAAALAEARRNGRVVKDEAETLLVRSDDGDGARWWKLYRVPPRKRIAAGRTRSRALREWRALCAMARAGLPVVPPVAFAEERTPAALRCSLVVTREVPHAEDLRSVLRRGIDGARRRQLLAAVGEAARALHETGFGHLRMQLRNLLGRESGDRWEISWLDAPYACQWPEVAPDRIRRVDLVDLAGSDSLLDEEDARLVLAAYAGSGDPPLSLAELRGRGARTQKLRRIAYYLGAVNSGHRPAAVEPAL